MDLIPVWSSPCEVIFLWGYPPLRLSFCEVFLLYTRLPVRLSFFEFFQVGHLYFSMIGLKSILNSCIKTIQDKIWIKYACFESQNNGSLPVWLNMVYNLKYFEFVPLFLTTEWPIPEAVMEALLYLYQVHRHEKSSSPSLDAILGHL